MEDLVASESTQSPRTLGTVCGLSPTDLSQVLRKMGDFVGKDSGDYSAVLWQLLVKDCVHRRRG